MSFRVIRFLTLACLLAFCSCSRKEERSQQQKAVVVAIEGDVDTFNPLFAEDVTAGEINDLLFPGLTGSEFDVATGTLHYLPLLARSWEWSVDRRDITFHLVSGARWSDGTPISSADVKTSYELYGDPEVASVRQSAVSVMRKSPGGKGVPDAAEAINDSTVVFHFERSYAGQLFDTGLPILPAHIFGKISRKELRSFPGNNTPLSSGPFSFDSWTPMQEIVLRSNNDSRVPAPAKISALVFRVIPDYGARLAQLQSGEVDIVTGIRPEDAVRIGRESETVAIVSTAGRDYDFLGWNNIDPGAFGSSGGKTTTPHRLFGSAKVRKALTIAIDRKALVDAYLGIHGREAIGGVSPLFRWAYNDTIKPLKFDKNLASQLLSGEGWRDSDGDGIIDKNGVAFRFVLKIAAGNQMRSVIATAIQQQLRDVGVDASIEQVERGTFWQDLMARKYDAWIAGFSVPLQMQLDDLWGSDLEKYPFNLAGYRNARIDKILGSVRALENETDGAALWKEFQAIVHQDQPYTFLFWINNIVGVNKRIHGSSIGVLGTTHRAWEWYTQGSAPIAGSIAR